MISTKALKVLVIVCVLALLSAVALIISVHRTDTIVSSNNSTPPIEAIPGSSHGKVSGFPLHEEPKSLPKLQFVDENGRALTLANFHDKVVLLNIWATWCVPCRREMPALDRLQMVLGGPTFEVLALSIDRQGLSEVKKFYDEYDLKALQIYVDASGRVARDLSVVGIPTTLLINRNGYEVGRMVGPAEWDAPELVSLFRDQLAVHIKQSMSQ